MGLFSRRFGNLVWAAVAAGGCAGAQPKVGVVEIFGVRKTGVEKVRKAVGVQAGETLPRSRVEVEERLEGVSGVLRARVEAACCEQGAAILYVGIQERGSAAPEFLPEPERDLTLPEAVIEAYRNLTEALARAGQGGDTAEDLTRGYALADNPAVRAEQERMLALAEVHGEALREALRSSQYADQRAVAAYALQYTADKAAANGDLQRALRDADETVRRNAARSLEALAVLARTSPGPELKVSGTWLVELLTSLVWSDRVGAARALLVLTESPDSHLTANIKERAWAALLETARWQHLAHALPAFLLLGRVAGWKDEATQAAWSAGEREKALLQIEKSVRRR
jgi:hypothetical protein